MKDLDATTRGDGKEIGTSKVAPVAVGIVAPVTSLSVANHEGEFGARVVVGTERDLSWGVGDDIVADGEGFRGGITCSGLIAERNGITPCATGVGANGRSVVGGAGRHVISRLGIVTQRNGIGTVG